MLQISSSQFTGDFPQQLQNEKCTLRGKRAARYTLYLCLHFQERTCTHISGQIPPGISFSYGLFHLTIESVISTEDKVHTTELSIAGQVTTLVFSPCLSLLMSSALQEDVFSVRPILGLHCHCSRLPRAYATSTNQCQVLQTRLSTASEKLSWSFFIHVA